MDVMLIITLCISLIAIAIATTNIIEIKRLKGRVSTNTDTHDQTARDISQLNTNTKVLDSKIRRNKQKIR